MSFHRVVIHIPKRQMVTRRIYGPYSGSDLWANFTTWRVIHKHKLPNFKLEEIQDDWLWNVSATRFWYEQAKNGTTLGQYVWLRQLELQMSIIQMYIATWLTYFFALLWKRFRGLSNIKSYGLQDSKHKLIPIGISDIMSVLMIFPNTLWYQLLMPNQHYISLSWKYWWIMFKVTLSNMKQNLTIIKKLHTLKLYHPDAVFEANNIVPS